MKRLALNVVAMKGDEGLLLHRLLSSVRDLTAAYLSFREPCPSLPEALAASSFGAVLRLTSVEPEKEKGLSAGEIKGLVERSRSSLGSLEAGDFLRSRNLPSWKRWQALWKDGRPLPPALSESLVAALKSPGSGPCRGGVLCGLEHGQWSDWSEKDVPARKLRRKALEEDMLEMRQTLRDSRRRKKLRSWRQRGGIKKRARPRGNGGGGRAAGVIRGLCSRAVHVDADMGERVMAKAREKAVYRAELRRMEQLRCKCVRRHARTLLRRLS